MKPRWPARPKVMPASSGKTFLNFFCVGKNRQFLLAGLNPNGLKKNTAVKFHVPLPAALTAFDAPKVKINHGPGAKR
ncbi:hypothetical protein OKW38_006467 [Paraburkholderia sp. MM5496-R1]|uniref:hypothetical protein n=1 Tax=unclassified Paraburkholderia TaxID=2615204 RepID=UPI003D212BE0